AAPIIVAKTPLRDWILQRALAHLDGHVEAGGASLGWFSPVALHEVTISGPDGKKLAHIARAATDKTLLNLLLDSHNVGKIRLENVQLQLEARESGVTLPKWLAKREGSATHAARPTLDIEIADGRIDLTDVPTNKSWRFEPIAATVVLGAEDMPLKV